MSFGRDHYNPSRGVKSSGFMVIYVRKAGKDHFDGSINRPLRTIGAALSKLPVSSDVGVVIDIGPGTWDEDINIPPVRFFGNRHFSRTVSTKLGLGGNDSNHLGLLLRGNKGSFYSPGFKTENERFNPKTVTEVDGNTNEIFFSPDTKIQGTITSQPSTCFELSCLEINTGKSDYNYCLCTYGSMATVKGVILKSNFCALSCESFSDIRLEGCYVKSKLPIRVRTNSITKIKDCVGIEKVDSTDHSLVISL